VLTWGFPVADPLCAVPSWYRQRGAGREPLLQAHARHRGCSNTCTQPIARIIFCTRHRQRGAAGEPLLHGRHEVRATPSIRSRHREQLSFPSGTDNEALLSSPFYVGARHRRVRGEAYRELLEETLEAVARRYGSSVLIAAQDMTFVNLASFLSQCASARDPLTMAFKPWTLVP